MLTYIGFFFFNLKNGLLIPLIGLVIILKS